MPNLVVIGETVRAYRFGDPLEKQTHRQVSSLSWFNGCVRTAAGDVTSLQFHDCSEQRLHGSAAVLPLCRIDGD